MKGRKEAQRQPSPDVEYTEENTENLIRNLSGFGTHCAMRLQDTVQ